MHIYIHTYTYRLILKPRKHGRLIMPCKLVYSHWWIAANDIHSGLRTRMTLPLAVLSPRAVQLGGRTKLWMRAECEQFLLSYCHPAFWPRIMAMQKLVIFGSVALLCFVITADAEVQFFTSITRVSQRVELLLRVFTWLSAPGVYHARDTSHLLVCQSSGGCFYYLYFFLCSTHPAPTVMSSPVVAVLL